MDLRLARLGFNEAAALSQADNGALWGIRLYGPMMFVDPATRQCVANQRDSAGALKERDGLWVGALPREQDAANTSFTWNGTRWTMMMWPLPEDRYARGRLMIHELFHRIQDDLGLTAMDADNGHLASRDGRIWLRLEWRSLREALIRHGDERRKAIADALVFRAARRALFSDGKKAERQLELNEGLAEYTGLRLCGLPAPILPDRAAVQLGQFDDRTTFVRNFAYASGPAYGILLDASGVDWRSKTTSATDLGDLLASAYNIALPDDPAGEAQRRAGQYDDGRVIAGETLREETRRRLQMEFQARLVDGPVLEVPASSGLRYSFNPNAVEAIEAGTVYTTTRVTDEWGVLEVTSGGALMLRGPGGVAAGLRVCAPTDPGAVPLKGDGWTLELAEGWSIVPGGRGGDWRVQRSP